jgi:biopolymer transport protein ExbD
MSRPSHAKKSRAETRMAPEEDPEFQIAPMIDILLVLLVFFMSISSTEVLQKTEGINLPVARDAKPADKNTKGQQIINILWSEVNNSGTILVGEDKVPTADAAIPKLQAGLKANDKMRVLIRADKKVRYEFLKQVMIAAGKAGVGNVTFSVVDKDAGGGAAAPAPAPGN